MKLPNGYGSVYKVKKNLRNPYRVVITEKCYESNGKIIQKRKTIGYARTKADGLRMLAMYQECPTDIRKTVAEVYELWAEEKYKSISDNTIKSYRQGWKRLEQIHNRQIAEMKTIDYENALNLIESKDVRKIAKQVINGIYEYALRYDYVSKDYSKLIRVDMKSEVKIQRREFTEDEIKKLWKYSSENFVKIILVGIYTGFRPNELMSLQYDADRNVLIGGSKTDAGKNRLVPVHPDIADILDYEPMSYRAYHYHITNDLDSAIGIKGIHPHDTRVTFASLADRYKMDQWMLKIMLGHAVDDLTRRVYIKKTDDEYMQEILKIPSLK